MNEKLYFKDKLVLKRNNISEREFNYTKIYDLSRIDEIPSLNQEKKILLLSSIKKILLCTNKYIDIFNFITILWNNYYIRRKNEKFRRLYYD